MPKGGRPRAPRTELDALREYANSLGPQKGFFSTLDELIDKAPFERAPVSEWRNYLKPGRMLKRDEVQFPLKQEELDYSEIQNILRGIETGGYQRMEQWQDPTLGLDKQEFYDPSSLRREDLVSLLRAHRPRFALDVSAETNQIGRRELLAGPSTSVHAANDRIRFKEERYGPRFDPRYSHQSNTLGRRSEYEESVTRMPDVVKDSHQHFTPDTLSHSRATSHMLPTAERMRLIEEIQSDLHHRAVQPVENIGPNSENPFEHRLTEDEMIDLQAARDTVRTTRYASGRERSLNAEQYAALQEATAKITELQKLAQSRVPERGYYTQAERARYNQLMSEEHLFEHDPLGSLTAAEYDEYAEAQRRADLAAITGHDQNVEISDEEWGPYYDRLTEPMRRLEAIARERSGWTDEKAAELQALGKRVEVGVSDAPYKNPADYAMLEMRKQLLDAVEGGQDYLALTRGQDQIDRYGLDGADFEDGVDDRAAGMKYFYDTLYPSVLKKLANRYGAEITEITAPVGSRKDTRPAIMRQTGVEELPEFLDEVDQRDSWQDRMHLLRTLPGQLGLHGEELLATNKIAKTIADIQEELILDFERPQMRTAETDKWREGKNASLQAALTEYKSILQPLLDAQKGSAEEANKTFPAIKLTPEVRERIKRVGVPLWSVVGGTVVFDDEEPQQFAKGGRVGHFDKLLKELREQNAESERLREEHYRRHPEARDYDNNVTRIGPKGRINPFIEKFGFGDKLKKAEGGSVQDEAEQYMRRSKFAGQELSSALKQGAHGFRTQWMGLDDKGALRPPVSSDWDAPKEEWVWNAEAQMALPPQVWTRPGIVDETLAIPDFFSAKGKLYDPPDVSKAASARVGALDTALSEAHDVPMPDGWLDYLGGSAGIMAGQLPVPSGVLKGAAGALGRVIPNFIKRGAEIASRVPGAKTVGNVVGSVPEFMLPTIEPSVSNYGMGTVAGAALMKYLPEFMQEDVPEEDVPFIDWTDPSLEQQIEDDLESGEISLDEAEYYLSEIRHNRARLEASELGDSGMAKGGRISIKKLRDRIGGKPLSGAYPINPKEDIGELVVDEEDFLIDGHKRLSGLEKWAERHGLDPSRVRVRTRTEYAKGGRVKPPPSKLALRERIAQLMSEASVPEHQQMVPVDPVSSPPVESVDPLEDLNIRVAPDKPSILETPVSRRSVLQGMRDLAGATLSPVDPMSMIDVNLDSLGKAVEAPVAVTKTALSGPKLAAFLTDAWGHIFHGSDESAIMHQADRFDQLEGGEEIASALREWYHRMHTDLPEGGYHNPANDPRDVDAALEKLNADMDLEGKLQEFADSRGLLVDPEGEWGEHGDMEFRDPSEVEDQIRELALSRGITVMGDDALTDFRVAPELQDFTDADVQYTLDRVPDMIAELNKWQELGALDDPGERAQGNHLRHALERLDGKKLADLSQEDRAVLIEYAASMDEWREYLKHVDDEFGEPTE
jgi:hypothetical protein